MAFRWGTPIGNMTVARGCAILAVLAMIGGIVGPIRLLTSARPALASSLVVLLVTLAGLLYSPAWSTGLAVAGNIGEALLILFVSLVLAQGVLRGGDSHTRALILARIPLWGYFPTGLLGVYQAFQLLIGERPTIPLLHFARLNENTLNSARTAFGSGLNEFNLDRVAAATGDPATYGIFSAITIGYCLWAKRMRLIRGGSLLRSVICLAFCGVILSASISAFIVLSICLLCNVPNSLGGWRRVVVSGAVAIGALMMLVAVLPAAEGYLLSAQQRVGSEVSGQGSSGVHLSLLSYAWDLFGSHPFFGVGTGGLTYHQFGYEVGYSSVHNVILLGLAEGGVALGVSLFAFWLSLWRRLVPRAILLPLTAAWLLYLDFNRLPALWVIVGIASVLSAWQRRSFLHAAHGERGRYHPRVESGATRHVDRPGPVPAVVEPWNVGACAMTPMSLAFYLPQFHPIPENDEWWGRGFTEWTNVVKGRPRFSGHFQPHLPADLGFYDLRLSETREAQAELAAAYGVGGFVYYHYWFAGRRLLERPFEEVLDSGRPDFPFALCWANESWTRRWDGSDQLVLVRQTYDEEDDHRHGRWLARAFADDRYIRVDGKPLFLVYRASALEEVRRTTRIWRDEARRAGVGEIFLVRVESFRDERSEPGALGFDAAVEFAPDWARLRLDWRQMARAAANRVGLVDDPLTRQQIYDYGSVVRRMLAKPSCAYLRFPCVTPGWDNTVRRARGAVVLNGSTPERYARWLYTAAVGAPRTAGGDSLIFVNAWNEWGEGCHLEPCQRWGRAYLIAHRNAMAAVKAIGTEVPR